MFNHNKFIKTNKRVKLSFILFIALNSLQSQDSISTLQDSLEKYYFNDYNKAINYAKDLYDNAISEKNDSLILSTINNKVEIYLIHSKLKLYNKEQQLYKEKLDSLSHFNPSLKKQLIQFHINHGIYLSNTLMHNDKAIAEFKKGLALLETQQEETHYNITKYQIYYWLSQCAKNTYRYHDAITYMENAIQAYIKYAKIKDIFSVNDMLQEYQFLASLNKNIGKQDVYEKHLKTSVIKAERLEKKSPQNTTHLIMVRNCYLNQFDFLIESNDIYNAEKYLQKIKRLNRNSKDTSSYRLKLSQLEMAKDNFKSSNEILLDEIKSATGKSSYRSIKYRNHLINNFIKQSAYDKAQSELTKIYDIVIGEQINTKAFKIENIKYEFNLLETLEQQSQVLLFQIQNNEDQKSNASVDSYLNFTFDFISYKRRNISSHADVLNSTNIFRNIINNYIRILSHLGEDIKLLKTIDFAKSFSLEFSKLKNQHLENNQLQQLSIQEVSLRKKILNFEKKLLSKNEESTSINDSLIHYRDQYQILENQFILKDDIFNELQFDNISNVNDLTKNVNSNQSIINYYILDNCVFIFHKTDDNITLLKKLNAEKLKRLLSHDLENLIDKKPLKYINEISEILLPSELKLKKNIVIVPHSYLYYLPFDILQFNSKNIYEDYNISYSHSEKFIHNKSRSKKAFSFLGLSPEFNGKCSDLKPLAHNQIEVQNISKLFSKRKVNKRKNLTLESFRDSCENHSIIHLATHAILDKDNSNNSYIALGSSCQDSFENRLYLKDILGLNMEPELVILSSCNSAIGQLVNGEGLTSLSKTLFHSNTKSVVSTLWNINDQSTSIIMTAFYENLKKGDAKDEALRKAKLKYLDNVDPDFRHPYYWSGVIPMGDMRPMFNNSKNYKVVAVVSFLILIGFLYRKRRKLNKAA